MTDPTRHNLARRSIGGRLISGRLIRGRFVRVVAPACAAVAASVAVSATLLAASPASPSTRPAAVRPPAAHPATRPADAPADSSSAAAAPATRPSGKPSPFGNRMVRLRDLGLAAPDWPSPGGDRPVSEAEWQEIETFGKDNFPNRWKMFEEIVARRGADSPLVKQLKDRFTGRYRLLMRIQRMMPNQNLYDAVIKQGQLEDDAWAAVIAARKQPKNPQLTEQMRQKVDALVKNLLQERQSRLDTLKQTIQDEQRQLDTDRDNVDDLVDRQIARLSGDDPGNQIGPRREGIGPPGGGGPMGGGPVGPGGFAGFGRAWDRQEPNEYRYESSPTTRPGG